jgi:hypothetical protein
VLLERISAEKQRLVKEGKIKKDKNESVIFRAPREVTKSIGYNKYVYLIFDGGSVIKMEAAPER